MRDVRRAVFARRRRFGGRGIRAGIFFDQDDHYRKPFPETKLRTTIAFSFRRLTDEGWGLHFAPTQDVGGFCPPGLPADGRGKLASPFCFAVLRCWRGRVGTLSRIPTDPAPMRAGRIDRRRFGGCIFGTVGLGVETEHFGRVRDLSGAMPLRVV